MENREPIGVFDSGVGGISLLRELVKIMPNENYLYLGDSQNAPYGTKSLEEVRRLTLENFLIIPARTKIHIVLVLLLYHDCLKRRQFPFFLISSISQLPSADGASLSPSHFLRQR